MNENGDKTSATPTEAPDTGDVSAQPVDAPVTAHEVDEDPEEHLGDTIEDPWDSDAQTDWQGGPREVND